MKQVTCVGFYGNQKAKDFTDLIKYLQTAIVNSSMGNDFRPYDLRQIHGTIIGMEKVIGFKEYVNLNMFEIYKKTLSMDFDRFIQIIKNQVFPIQLRFGGFKQDYSDFISCPKSGMSLQEPYYRSFSINVKMGKVILIGWPHHDNDFINNKKLLNMRTELKTNANIVHKYDHWEDNDFFVVIGDIYNKSLWLTKKSEIDSLNDKLRNYMYELNGTKGIDIGLNINDIYLVQYVNESLELQSSDAYNLYNFNFDLNIGKFYF